MKFQEIEKMTEHDLQKKLHEQRVKLRELRFSIANNQLKQVHQVSEVKRAIARILTVLRARRQPAPVAVVIDKK